MVCTGGRESERESDTESSSVKMMLIFFLNYLNQIKVTYDWNEVR